MMRSVFSGSPLLWIPWLVMGSLGLALAGCQTLGKDRKAQTLGLDEIVRLHQNGVSDEDIIEKIQATGSNYRLNSDQVVRLREQGLSPELVDYLMQTAIDDAIRQGRQFERLRSPAFPWWYGSPWGDPYYGFGYSPYFYDPLLHDPLYGLP